MGVTTRVRQWRVGGGRMWGKGSYLFEKFKKKRKKINNDGNKGTPNKSSKRKRNDVRKVILSVENSNNNNNEKKMKINKDVGIEKTKDESIIRIGDTVNVSDLLFTKNRNYLITCNQSTNKRVKANDLAGKAPVINLRDIYSKLDPQGDFEIVFVALRGDTLPRSTTRECLRKIFSMMPPCPAIPLSDQKSIKRLERIFDFYNNVDAGPMSIIIDPRGVVLQSHATPLFLRYGAAGYPFTNERIHFLDSEDNLVRMQPLSMEKLLASPERDYLINNKGGQVPLHILDDKVVGLYFCPCLDGLRTTRNLEKVYQELSKNMEDFEIVLIYTHGWCEHEDTCGLLDEDSFLDEIKIMPWLALSFKDTNCNKKLQRVFQYPQELEWPKPDARLVIIGPHGKFIEPLGTHILLKYGAPAYPFTFLSAVNLELERAKKVKTEMFWELDAVFTQNIGSQVRFSQLVGKRIIVLFETYRWRYDDTLRELKARYFKMKGTDDEFEVIHIFCNEWCSTHIKAPMPWLMHPPFDQDSYADKFISCVFGTGCGLVAFDRDGSVVRVKKHPELGDNEVFPFYHDGDMENEVLLNVKENITFRLESVYENSWL